MVLLGHPAPGLQMSHMRESWHLYPPRGQWVSRGPWSLPESLKVDWAPLDTVPCAELPLAATCLRRCDVAS